MPVSGRHITPADMRHVRSIIGEHHALLQSRLSYRIRELPLLLSFDSGEVDLLAWLKSRSVFPRCYWASRGGEFELAGSGAALSVAVPYGMSVSNGYSRIAETLRLCEDNSMLFVGGQAFDASSRPDSLWASFPALRFVVPETMLMRRGDRFSIGLAVRVQAGDSMAAAMSRAERLFAGTDIGSGHGSESLDAGLLSRQDHPDSAGWFDTVGESLEAIERGLVER